MQRLPTSNPAHPHPWAAGASSGSGRVAVAAPANGTAEEAIEELQDGFLPVLMVFAKGQVGITFLLNFKMGRLGREASCPPSKALHTSQSPALLNSLGMGQETRTLE